MEAMRSSRAPVEGLSLEEEEERLMRIAMRESSAESKRGAAFYSSFGGQLYFIGYAGAVCAVCIACFDGCVSLCFCSQRSSSIICLGCIFLGVSYQSVLVVCFIILKIIFVPHTRSAKAHGC